MAMKFYDIMKANDTNGMDNREIVNFHLHAENGLYQAYRVIYKQLENLLDESKITSGQFNKIMSHDFNTKELLRMAELKRPQNVKLNAWIANAENVIKLIERFVMAQSNIVLEHDANATTATMHGRKIASIAGKMVQLHDFTFIVPLLYDHGLNYIDSSSIVFESRKQAIDAFYTILEYHKPLKLITWHIGKNQGVKSIQAIGCSPEKAAARLSSHEQSLIKNHCTQVIQL